MKNRQSKTSYYRVSKSAIEDQDRGSVKKVNEHLIRSLYTEAEEGSEDLGYMSRIQEYRRSLVTGDRPEEQGEIDKFKLIKDFRETEARLVKQLRQAKEELYGLRRREKEFRVCKERNLELEKKLRSNSDISKIIESKQVGYEHQVEAGRIEEAERIVKRLRSENSILKSKFDMLRQENVHGKKVIGMLEQRLAQGTESDHASRMLAKVQKQQEELHSELECTITLHNKEITEMGFKISKLTDQNLDLQAEVEHLSEALKLKSDEAAQIERRYQEEIIRLKEEGFNYIEFDELKQENKQLQRQSSQIMDQLYNQKMKNRDVGTELLSVGGALEGLRVENALLKFELCRTTMIKDGALRASVMTQTLDDFEIEATVEEDTSDGNEYDESVPSVSDISGKKGSIILCDSQFSESEINSYSPQRISLTSTPGVKSPNRSKSVNSKSSHSSSIFFEKIQIPKKNTKNQTNHNTETTPRESIDSSSVSSKGSSSEKVQSVDLHTSKEIFSLTSSTKKSPKKNPEKEQKSKENSKSGLRDYSVDLKLDSSDDDTIQSNMIQSYKDCSLKYNIDHLKDIDFTNDNLFVSSKKSSCVQSQYHENARPVTQYTTPNNTGLSHELKKKSLSDIFEIEEQSKTSNENSKNSNNVYESRGTNLAYVDSNKISSSKFKKRGSPSRNGLFGLGFGPGEMPSPVNHTKSHYPQSENNWSYSNNSSRRSNARAKGVSLGSNASGGKSKNGILDNSKETGYYSTERDNSFKLAFDEESGYNGSLDKKKSPFHFSEKNSYVGSYGDGDASSSRNNNFSFSRNVFHN